MRLTKEIMMTIWPNLQQKKLKVNEDGDFFMCGFWSGGNRLVYFFGY